MQSDGIEKVCDPAMNYRFPHHSALGMYTLKITLAQGSYVLKSPAFILRWSQSSSGASSQLTASKCLV